VKKNQKMSATTRARLATSMRIAWARRKGKPTPGTSHFIDHRPPVERFLDRMSAHHDHELINGTYVAASDGGRATFRGARHGVRLSSMQDAV